MSQHHARMSGSARQRMTRAVLAASTICHLCGHDGADAADHVIPLARGGADDRTNLAPAHHDVPCPTCGIKCNRVKGDKLVAPIVRRSGSLATPRGTGPSRPTQRDCGA